MSDLFKPTYTKEDAKTGERATRRTRKWYGRYNDADGVTHRVPLCEDKAAAQVMLAKLIRNADRQGAGLVDPAAEHLKLPIAQHIEDYRRHLLVKGRSEDHISETLRLIKTISSECRYQVLADLHVGGDRLEEYLAARMEAGRSYRTINADLVAVRSFCRWLLSKKRMHDDPTAGLQRLNEEEDRRRERRALTDEEARRLIQTTFDSERDFRELTGVDRAMLYLLAQRTGLRRKELRSLTPGSFDLGGDVSTVTVAAARSKRRQRDVLPLTRDVVEMYRDYLKDRDSNKVIWAGGWWRRSAEMLRLDLADSGVPAIDDQGRVVDFHGQRTTFITGLARAGVSPANAQKLARHSDINLTLGTYTKLQAEDLAGAIEKLPDLSPTAGTRNVADLPAIAQPGGPSMSETPRAADLKLDQLPADLEQLAAAIDALPGEYRQTIEPMLAQVAASSRRRQRILTLVQEALANCRWT